MATKYNVYASGIDYDSDSDGEWVKAEDHASEVEGLEEQIDNLQSRIDDFETSYSALECDKEALQVENDRLRKALQDIIDS